MTLPPLSSTLALTVSWLFILAAALSAGGCAQRGAPMHTAIIDLTGESRVVRSKGGPFDLVTIASHHQTVSIAGILQMPDVGQGFNFPAKHDITTAVGIAVAQSYRLIGEADVPDGWNRVTEVRAALEDVQAEALRASLLTMEIVRLRRTAEGLCRSRDLEGTVRAKNDAAIAATTERNGVEEELRKAEKRLREVANTPGIIVARWKADRSGGGAWTSARWEAQGRSPRRTVRGS